MNDAARRTSGRRRRAGRGCLPRRRSGRAGRRRARSSRRAVGPEPLERRRRRVELLDRRRRARGARARSENSACLARDVVDVGARARGPASPELVAEVALQPGERAACAASARGRQREDERAIASAAPARRRGAVVQTGVRVERPTRAKYRPSRHCALESISDGQGCQAGTDRRGEGCGQAAPGRQAGRRAGSGARRRSIAGAVRGAHKTALVLGGGGFTGGVYEIGALRALDLLAVNSSVNQFDVYVGTSAGAFIAALCANGVTPEEMMRVVTRQGTAAVQRRRPRRSAAAEPARVRAQGRGAAAARAVARPADRRPSAGASR